jgi:hypothetical protein
LMLKRVKASPSSGLEPVDILKMIIWVLWNLSQSSSWWYLWAAYIDMSISRKNLPLPSWMGECDCCVAIGIAFADFKLVPRSYMSCIWFVNPEFWGVISAWKQ